MSRAYIVYILTAAALVGGLWVILTLGVAIAAPDDLSGQWLIAWTDQPAGSEGVDSTMNVEQSGRYFTIRIDQNEPMSLALQPGWKGTRDGQWISMMLSGGPQRLKISAPLQPGKPPRAVTARVELTGPIQRVGVARRRGESPSVAAATHPAESANAR